MPRLNRPADLRAGVRADVRADAKSSPVSKRYADLKLELARARKARARGQ